MNWFDRFALGAFLVVLLGLVLAVATAKPAPAVPAPAPVQGCSGFVYRVASDGTVVGPTVTGTMSRVWPDSFDLIAGAPYSAGHALRMVRVWDEGQIHPSLRVVGTILSVDCDGDFRWTGTMFRCNLL